MAVDSSARCRASSTTSGTTPSRRASRSTPATRSSSIRATPPTATTRRPPPTPTCSRAGLPRATRSPARSGARRAARRRAGGRDPRDGAGADFGWTAIRPGRGLLPEADFPKPFLQIWDLSDGTPRAHPAARVAVPLEPFPGVMGAALDEPGGHSTMPPRQERRQHGHQAAHRRHHALPAGVGRRRAVQRRRRPRRPGRRRGLRHRGRDERARHARASSLRAGRRPPRAAVPHDAARSAPARRGPCFATTAHGPDLFASSPSRRSAT